MDQPERGVNESSSDGSAETPRDASSLIALLRWRALRQPRRLAYTYLADGEAEEINLTYSELDRRARDLGARLQSIGAERQRVLLLYPPGLDFVVAFFGCLYAAAIPVPVYSPRSDRPLHRLQSIAEDAGAALVLTTASGLRRMQSSEAGSGVPALRWLATDEPEDDLAERWRQPDVDDSTIALLQYTSGSTAAPKGVVVTHGNLLHNEAMIQRVFRQTEQSVIVGWLPLYHDMGLIGTVLQPLYVGARCVLMSPLAFLQRPLRWLEAISRYRATTSGGPNFAYDLCVRRVGAEQLAALDLSSWDVAFNGAEPVYAETLQRFAATFEPCGFRREAFHPCYGLAEATLLVTGKLKPGFPVVKEVSASALKNNRIVEAAGRRTDSQPVVSCGGNPSDQKVLIVNPESLTECDADEVGEIWVSGGSVAQGYWNRPDESKETFQARLAGTGGGAFLRTGDLGFVRDGELYVTGRLKDLIIIRGFNYYPQDVEATLARSHPAVRPHNGAAFSVEVADEERLVVVQEVERRARHDSEGIIENIRQALAQEHELTPYAVVLLEQGGIPKTSSGKVRRRACRDAFLRGSLKVLKEWREAPPPLDAGVIQVGSGRPQSAAEVEAWLVSQLESRSGLNASRIDVGKPFTHYGFDSLAAVELIHSFETHFGVSLSLASLFQNPSIQQLAVSAFEQLRARASAPPTGKQETPHTGAEHALSRGQQALWLQHHLSPDSPVHNIAAAVRIHADLDRELLRRTFQLLTERHPALRTTFNMRQGRLVQTVHARAASGFKVEDVSVLDAEAIGARLNEEARRPFDLESGPLLRVSLLACGPRQHILLLVVHHIVADFWSLNVLVDEMFKIYAAEKRGTPATLPPLVSDYGDFVRWQERLLSSPAGNSQRTFWEKQLAGTPPVLNLPIDKPRPPLQTYRGASLPLRLDAALGGKLTALSAEHDATLFMTLLAAFQVLLYRYTGQKTFFTASPTAGRNRAEWAGVVGYFVNLLALRADLAGSPTFVEYLSRVRQVVLEAFDNLDYPFASLLEQLSSARDPGRSPVFQVAFVMQKAHLLGGEGLSPFALGEAGAQMEVGEFRIESLALEQRAALFDLTLVVAEADDGLVASLQYNTDLFEAESISRMLGHFQTLLEGIAASPDSRVEKLPLLTPAEERRQVEWNDNRSAYPRRPLVHQLFESRAEQSPHAVAVSSDDRRLSYGELERRANQLAHRLRRLGVGPEVPVGVLLGRSVEMVVAQLGVLKAGGFYIPIDPAYPKQRQAKMLEDAGARVLITREELAVDLPSEGAARLFFGARWENISSEPESPPTGGARPDNLAYVIYTSGSTGEPKGVAVTHEALLNLVFWHLGRFQVMADDRATLLAGVGFDASVWELWPYLAAGASLHIPDGEVVATPERLRDWLVARAITVCFLPTPLAESCLTLNWPEGGVLRLLLTGGDKLRRRPADSLPFELINNYGPTENTVVATSGAVAAGSPTDSLPSLGRPISNTQVFILDGNLQFLPAGAVGEIYLGGESLARCYLQRPAQTAERFIPHPYSDAPGARLYRTGDLGRYRSDGEVEFAGRTDEQIKLRGYRIELGEVEAVLRGHEAVSDAVVAARENASGHKRLVAYVVPGPRPMPSRDELRAYLSERLPEYMVPASYVRLAEVPLTPNGKVDRRALPEPEPEESEGTGELTPVEELLAGIWSEVLGVGRIGVHDDFFELGGHSLLAARIITRIRDELHVEVPLYRIFEAHTIRRLAEVVTELKGVAAEPPKQTIMPLSRDSRRVKLSSLRATPAESQAETKND